jgi:hypothetical protein
LDELSATDIATLATAIFAGGGRRRGVGNCRHGRAQPLVLRAHLLHARLLALLPLRRVLRVQLVGQALHAVRRLHPVRAYLVDRVDVAHRRIIAPPPDEPPLPGENVRRFFRNASPGGQPARAEGSRTLAWCLIDGSGPCGVFLRAPDRRFPQPRHKKP